MTKLSGSQLPWPVLAAVAGLSEREKQEIIRRLEAKREIITTCNHKECQREG